MATGDEVLSEPFSASARPTPSAEEVAEKTRRMQEEHTNNQRPKPGDTPDQLGAKLITIACIYEPWPEHGEIARELIDKGANIHFRDDGGATALLKASGAANAPLVKLLLEKGADPNTCETRGNDGALGRPICYAAYRSSAEVVKLLLEAGANPDARTTGPDGRTALMLAIDYARQKDKTEPCPDTVIALIEGGASPDLPRFDGWTALSYSLSNKMPNTAKYLIAHGADPELPNGDMTPLRRAELICPDAVETIKNAIAQRREQERTVKAERDHLDQWMKDGCPAESAAKPMAKLKLRTKAAP
ncbi:MAG: ankyrin repeat domain-containing protein [Alphaproteobacteria bacterium]